MKLFKVLHDHGHGHGHDHGHYRDDDDAILCFVVL